MGDSGVAAAVALTVIRAVPTPGQAGAQEFDGNNATDFLDQWEMFCEHHRFNEEGKCRRLLK